MKPFDPRLLEYAKSTRSFLIQSAVLSIVNAVAVITQAVALAHIINSVFFQHKALADNTHYFYALISALVIRVVVAWRIDTLAFAAATQVKTELREAAFHHIVALGPLWMNSARAINVTNTLTRGLDALDAYFAKYVPSLLNAAFIPVLLALVVGSRDWLSLVIITLTLPLIPFFMILIGRLTSARVDSQWKSLNKLSLYFSDLISGLPTLLVFGQAKRQEEALSKHSTDYRDSTMSVLRISFLSALALELISTLSVALLAVSIGLRLVNGSMGFEAALLVLILAPDVYLPIRQVGLNFHASTEGLQAANEVFSIVETQVPAGSSGTVTITNIASGLHIDARHISLGYAEHSVINDLSFTCAPGTVTAIVGASGAGKSTIVNALLGFLPLFSGTLQIDGQDLSNIDLENYRSHISYVAQSPWLGSGTVRSILDPAGTISDAALLLHGEAAGLALDGTDVMLANGLDTQLSAAGKGLSAGQQRRLALARALVRDGKIVLLDEPTAMLDSDTEEVIAQTIRRFAQQGKTVIMVAHRANLIALADHIIDVEKHSVVGAS